VATRTIEIHTSDLTGTEISNEGEQVEIRVLNHPDIDVPVRLDAYALEVQGLFNAAEQYVSVEVVMPGQRPQPLMVSAVNFARLFTTDMTETLKAATPLAAHPASATRTKRRATPVRDQTATPAMSKEQRGAVRDWANANGFQVGERGRIKSEIISAFEAAHAG
jgi:hypothetical protein